MLMIELAHLGFRGDSVRKLNYPSILLLPAPSLRKSFHQSHRTDIYCSVAFLRFMQNNSLNLHITAIVTVLYNYLAVF